MVRRMTSRNVSIGGERNKKRKRRRKEGGKKIEANVGIERAFWVKDAESENQRASGSSIVDGRVIHPLFVGFFPLSLCLANEMPLYEFWAAMYPRSVVLL